MAIITISRGTFSGGKALAECVAERLGFRCISREVLVKAARDHSVPLEKLSKALDEVPGILERTNLERVHYLAYVQEALTKEVKDEQVVYHGLAGHLLLKGVPHVLKVRVIANMEFRIKAAMERRNLNWHNAIKSIEKIDVRRDKWVRFLYHVDRNDPSIYDLTINLDRISLSSACEIVCLNASQAEFRATPESKERLADLVLSAEVRAKIASDDNIADDRIEIEAHDGIITIGGTVHSLEDADRTRELVRRQPGVKGIESRLRALIQTEISW
ncbi:cytidylate kinase family protein [Chloroflexota bacterium]